MFKAYVPKITLSGRETRKGDGIGMRCGGQAMLVDGFEGGEPTNNLMSWLASEGVSTIEVAVLSHIHYDHYNGLLQIEADGRFHIKLLYMTDPLTLKHGCDGSANGRAVKEDMDNAYKFIRKMQSYGTRVLWLDKGSTIKCGDVSFRVWRKQPTEFQEDEENGWAFVNDGSLILWSPETQLLLGGDGPTNIKEAIAYFGAKVSGYDISHHGNNCSQSNAQALKAAGCVVAWESNVERDGAGTTDFTMYGARRVVQQGIPVWMQDAPIYITAAKGKIVFRQGDKTISKAVPYSGEGSTDMTGEWKQGSKGWWYQYADGSYATGWAYLPWSGGKDWFYFDSDGWMQTGWKKLKWSKGEDWFFFDFKTGAMKVGWQKLPWGDGKEDWFLLDPKTGAMLTGWQWSTKDGKSGWYYLDPKTGAMKTGWLYDDGEWYCLGEDGRMLTGWVRYKGRRCYLEPLSDKTHIQGRCYVNCRATIDGKLYSFDSDGYATEVKTSGTVSTVAPGTRVIDVSEFQPDNIDWNKVKKSGHAVVLRMGLRGSIKGTPRYRKVGHDYHFKMYIEGVIKAGIPYSVYYFPTPLSDEEADQEADWIIMNVAGLNLSMPLWLDSERVDKGVANDISTATRTRYLKRITDKLVAAGIPCGIYASTSWLNNQINMGELPQQVRDNTWCAQYADKCTYDGVYAMWQYYNRAKVPGIDDEVDISIVKRQFNMSCKKSAPKENAMTKDNVKVFPVTNPVKISNSGSDERGNYKGGTAGDNTGREWQIRDWYNRPWNCVLRHPDPEVRACLADLATKAANNNKIGYDQYQRETYWRELQKAGYDPSKITVACESDCSAGVIANIKAVGHILGRPELQNITCTYTGNMRSGLTAAGFACLTESKYLTSSAYLVAGDVLLNDKHHTATAVTNGVSAGTGEITASAMPLIKRGSKGAAVLQLQKLLNSKGYKLSEDSDFGPATEAAVRAFQKANHLETDGEVGPLTWAALLK